MIFSLSPPWGGGGEGYIGYSPDLPPVFISLAHRVARALSGNDGFGSGLLPLSLSPTLPLLPMLMTKGAEKTSPIFARKKISGKIADWSAFEKSTTCTEQVCDDRLFFEDIRKASFLLASHAHLKNLFLNCWRPYRVECTRSLSTSEVKRHRAQLVLGWGTAWEAFRVLPAFYLLFCSLTARTLDFEPRGPGSNPPS